jgi:hypothetical protein
MEDEPMASDEGNEQSHTIAETPARRRTGRVPISNLLVAIDAPDISEQPWVVDAFDINSLGLGLILPPELPEGTQVLLSFKLSETNEFSRVPATVLHQLGASGGVRFDGWSTDDRLNFLEYLVGIYETAEG